MTRERKRKLKLELFAGNKDLFREDSMTLKKKRKQQEIQESNPP